MAPRHVPRITQGLRDGPHLLQGLVATGLKGPTARLQRIGAVGQVKLSWGLEIQRKVMLFQDLLQDPAEK